MSRIPEVFAQLKRDGRKGFIPFIVAGDPDLETTPPDANQRLSGLKATAFADLVCPV